MELKLSGLMPVFLLREVILKQMRFMKYYERLFFFRWFIFHHLYPFKRLSIGPFFERKMRGDKFFFFSYRLIVFDRDRVGVSVYVRARARARFTGDKTDHQQ